MERDRVALVCPTRNRPAALRRAFASYLDNAVRCGERCEVVLADSSVLPAIQEQNQTVLAGACAAARLPGRYVGRSAKEALAQTCARASGCDEDVIRFALSDSDTGLFDIGSNYNALVLSTVGALMIAVDDDTLCEPAQRRDACSGMRRIDATRPFTPCWPGDLWTFDSVDAARLATVSRTTSFVGLHRATLGAASVRLTVPGTVGDCGWGTPSYFLLLADDSLGRLTRTEETYRRACTRRAVVSGVDRMTLVPGIENFVSMCFGLDNRTLVPPFLPVGRGSDRAFGVVLSLCHQDERVAHLPWLTLHVPLEQRRFVPGEVMRSASGIDVASAVIALLRAARLTPGRDAAARMRALGDHLQSAAGGSREAFGRLVRTCLERELSNLEQALQARLHERGEAAPWWRRDVARFLSLMRSSLRQENAACPIELRACRGQDLGGFQRLVLQYGRLLSHWPRIWDSARAAPEDVDDAAPASCR